MSGVTKLKDIAKVAGVSKMTVSRVLRNDPAVSDGTRESVWQAAKALGYRPDPVVAAFMRRVRGGKAQVTVLAYLTAYEMDSPFGHQIYLSQMREGARARAEALGFRLDEFNLPGQKISAGRLGQILQARGIQGLLVAPLPRAGRLSMDFRPFVSAVLGTSLLHPDLHRVQSNHTRNIALALRELRRRGVKRVGLVLDEVGDSRTEHVLYSRMLYFQSHLEKTERIPTLVLPDVEEVPVLRWIDKYRPEAVLGFSFRVRMWLEARGGERPLVVNLNCAPRDGSDFGIDQQTEKMGAAGVELVVEQLYSNQFGIPDDPKTVMLSGRWVSGLQQEKR